MIIELILILKKKIKIINSSFFVFYKKTFNLFVEGFQVRVIGLEPTRREAPDPKSGMSTNFTTPAELLYCVVY